MAGTDALSKKILLDPVAGMKDSEFKRLRAEDPELEELHPLARAVALVRLSRGSETRVTVEGAVEDGMESCEIVHRRRWRRVESYREGKESVEHELMVSHRGRELRLQFESDGEVVDADEEAPTNQGRVSLEHLLDDGLTNSTRPGDLYRMWSERVEDEPMARSEADGNVVGGMSYRLIRVDDVRIRSGGGWRDRYNELENDHSDADGDDHTFRLGELLSNSEARALGLEHPEATMRILVRPEALAASYAKGLVRPNHLTLEVSAEWSNRPLVTIPILKTGRSLSPDLKKLLRSVERVRDWLRA